MHLNAVDIDDEEKPKSKSVNYIVEGAAQVMDKKAGGKKKAARLAERLVLPMLKEAGVQVETRATERQGHAGEMGRTLPLAGVDALLVMGGDGTLSAVRNA